MNKTSINFYKSLPHSNVCSSLRVFFNPRRHTWFAKYRQ